MPLERRELLMGTTRCLAARYHKPSEFHTLRITCISYVRYVLQSNFNLVDFFFNFVNFNKGKDKISNTSSDGISPHGALALN